MAWPAEQLWFKCNDNAANTVVADSSTNATNGTFTGGKNTSAASVAGKINLALTFDGSVDYISSGNILNPGTGNWSAGCWFKTGSHGASSRGLIDKSAASAAQIGLYIQNAGKVRAAIQSDGSNYQVIDSLAAVDDNAWHQTYLTWDGSAKTLKLYVDNVDQGPPFLTAGTVGDVTNTAALVFANSLVSLIFPGTLDDIRIYTSVLTAEQVSALNKSGSGTEASLASLEPSGFTPRMMLLGVGLRLGLC